MVRAHVSVLLSNGMEWPHRRTWAFKAPDCADSPVDMTAYWYEFPSSDGTEAFLASPQPEISCDGECSRGAGGPCTMFSTGLCHTEIAPSAGNARNQAPVLKRMLTGPGAVAGTRLVRLVGH